MEGGASASPAGVGGRVSARNAATVVARRDLLERSGVTRSSSCESAADPSPKECTMCGDVGFESDLVLCTRCGYRFQHTYCSKLYPNLAMDAWACDWCLYEDEKNGSPKASKLGKRGALAVTESRNKAFEFLLQIAQAGPGSESFDERPPSKRQREESDARVCSAVCRNGNPNGNAQKQIFRCGGGGEGGKEVAIKMEPLDVNGSGNYSDENESKCPQQQQQASSRKQRPGPERNTSKAEGERWKNVAKNKLLCNTASGKVMGRRYKLLADVLC